MRPVLLLAVVLSLSSGLIQGQMVGDADLDLAYKLLPQKDYDGAIAAFRRGLEKQPQNASAHKDLAYTLLKAGDNPGARDEFEKAMRLNIHDETAALEYAFLCNDTQKPIEARRTFDRLRKYGATAATKATAEQAFENIDQPLAKGIARWRQALERSPNAMDLNLYSAHWELAHLAELRDELPLAAEQYEICRQMKPQVYSLLLDLARVWQQLNQAEQAHAALVAASRGPDPRTAEQALELLGPRYPYVYEFVNAIKLDPHNVPLRRELAYLYLALHKETEAIAEFQQVVELAPGDELATSQLAALRRPAKGERATEPDKKAGTRPLPGAEPKVDPKVMGQRSLAAGYVKDAIRYLQIAHEANPSDAEVMLKLGWAYNLAHDDRTAMTWFDRARKAGDEAIAKEADHAWHNLRGGGTPDMTAWMLPMYSSRWNDAFTYGQIKHNLPFLNSSWVHPYLSARIVGDVRGKIDAGSLGPQYLSESSFIIGAGIATKLWHHLLGWGEAGEAISYLPGRHDVGGAIPDYRGGINFAKGFGNLLGSKQPGLFYETTADGIYVHRFDRDWMFFSQHRMGRTFLVAGNSLQIYANANYTRDLKSQYWANTIEFGPGLRWHWSWLPPGVYFSTDLLRGVYTNNQGNPRRPNYTDLRIGFWYARSR